MSFPINPAQFLADAGAASVNEKKPERLWQVAFRFLGSGFLL